MWGTSKRIKVAYELGLRLGYTSGFVMGQLYAMRKILLLRKVMDEEPLTPVEKQIDDILRKAEDEDRKRNHA